jgi:hypothetical protein
MTVVPRLIRSLTIWLWRSTVTIPAWPVVATPMNVRVVIRSKATKFCTTISATCNALQEPSSNISHASCANKSARLVNIPLVAVAQAVMVDQIGLTWTAKIAAKIVTTVNLEMPPLMNVRSVMCRVNNALRRQINVQRVVRTIWINFTTTMSACPNVP